MFTVEQSSSSYSSENVHTLLSHIYQQLSKFTLTLVCGHPTGVLV